MCTMNSESQGGTHIAILKYIYNSWLPAVHCNLPSTELNTQAIYPWCCNFSLLPLLIWLKTESGAATARAQGTEFEIFQSLSNFIQSDDCSVFKKKSTDEKNSPDYYRKQIHENVL